jgi:transcription elongation GreA/GreB family factor
MDETRIEKTELLRQVIAQLEETVRRLGSGYAVAKQATLDSPHVMKSKREVTGIEASYLANALAGNIQEREFWLRSLRELRLPESPERVALGCVVGVGPADGMAESLYFILPVCGGMEVSIIVNDRKQIIRVITPGSTVARGLIGKSLGEELELQRPSTGPSCIRLLF